MWLPKDERKLLVFYFRNLSDTDVCKNYGNVSMRVIAANRKLKERGLIDFYKYTKDTIERANKYNSMTKEERKYRWTDFTTEWELQSLQPIHDDLAHFFPDSEEAECKSTFFANLTLEGLDLGRKYNGWWYKTGGMWWAEYKGHWFWTIAGIIVSFLLGLLTGKLTSP
jgi:hypothetical protein